MFNPRSQARFGFVSTACVSLPRDWAVSTSSHMQQDKVIVSHLHVSALHFSHADCSPQKTWIRKIGDNLLIHTVVLGACFNARLPPRGA